MMFIWSAYFDDYNVSFVLTFRCSIHYYEHQALVNYKKRNKMPWLNFHPSIVDFIEAMNFFAWKMSFGPLFWTILLFNRNHFFELKQGIAFFAFIVELKKGNFSLCVMFSFFLWTFIKTNKFFLLHCCVIVVGFAWTV